MKVIFIDTVHPVLKEMLEAKGVKCIMHHQTPQQEIEQIISNYDGIVIRSRIKLDKHFLSKAANLKFIARSGSGLENIDLEYCKQKNIQCFNSPEGNQTAVAEHAIAMLLTLFNNLILADSQVRKGIWKREENRGIELEGKTVGIVGYGYMGNSLAKRLSAFNCRILAYDKYKKNYSDQYVCQATMDTIYNECDILSLHIPLTEETHYLVNKHYLNQFKKNIYLINTSRGKCVNTIDLAEAIKSGKVKGACLDVLEYELSSFENLQTEKLPEAFHYLISSKQVVLSPHIAGWTHESYYKLSKILADKIISHFAL
jgi:D-3-phosphoglycerate dehydrogenase